MKLRRILQNATEGLRTAKVNRLARSAWATVAVLLFSCFRGGDWSLPTWQFIGKAAEPTAGAGDSVDLKAGLALWHDTAENDDWTGQLKPVFLESSVAISFSTNNDASGDPRIDLLAIKPDLVSELEDDPDNPGSDLETWFKDEVDETRYKKAEPQLQRWDYKYTIVEGVPAAAPAAPATPAGFVAVAEVTRPNGQVDVLARDVKDVRPRAEMHLDRYQVGERVRFEDPATGQWTEFRLKDGAAGRVLEVENDDGTGRVDAEVLGAMGRVQFGDDAGTYVDAQESAGVLEITDDAGARARVDCKGAALASVFVDGDGTVRSQFGPISAVTRVGEGDYSIDLDPAKYNLAAGYETNDFHVQVTATRFDATGTMPPVATGYPADDGVGFFMKAKIYDRDETASTKTDARFTMTIFYVGD